MIHIQIEILLLVAVGFLVTKIGLLSARARAELTNVVLYVILPCNIFGSFQQDISPEILRQCGVVLVISFAAQIFYFALNKFLYRRVPRERRVVLQYATICNNAGFMGLPIIGRVFGSTGILYGAIILIPLRVFMWTVGLSLYTAAETKQKVKALATHPCIWAVILGLGSMLLPFELPAFFTDTVSALGGCTTALSMLIVGSILSEVEIKSVLDRSCFYFSAIRLVAIPAVMFGALTLAGADPLVRGACVLSSAMPAATATAMLAAKYGCDARFASRVVFVSTALSLITLPLVVAVIT